MSGIDAPSANARNDEIAATHGDPSWFGSSPSSSRASVSSATSDRRMIVVDERRAPPRARRPSPGRSARARRAPPRGTRAAPHARCAARSRTARAATGSRSTRPTPSRTRRRPARRRRRAARCCCRWCRRPRPSPARSWRRGRRSRRRRWPAARRRCRRGGGPRSARCGRRRGCPASPRSCGPRPPPAAPSRRWPRRRRGSGRPRPPRCAASAGSTASVPKWRARKHSTRTRNGIRGASRLDARVAQQARPVLGVALLGVRELEEHARGARRRRTRRARGTARRRRPRRRTCPGCARAASASSPVSRRHADARAIRLSSPTSQRHRPCGGASRPAALRSRARRMPSISPGRSLPDRRRRRACRRSSAPSASRTRWRGSRSAARRRPRRPTTTRARVRIVVEPSGPLRQKRREVVLADERVGAEPQRAQVERLGDPPREPGAERIGHRPVHDRVAVRAPPAPSGGRRSRPSTSSRVRTTISGPSMRVHRARQPPRIDVRRRRRTITTWPHACTPASVRPAHASVDRRARSTLRERVRRARPRRCAARGCAANPWKSVPSYATTSLQSTAARRIARADVELVQRAAGSDQFDARHGRVVAGARAELQDAQCSRRCGRRSAARSRRTACAWRPCRGSSRRPGAAGARRRSSPW